MRLFVAIQLSDEMKKAVTGTLHTMKQKGIRGNYVPLQHLHITLAFIGEMKDPDAVKEALSGISIKPFRLSFSDMGTFGDLLWVGMQGNQGLSAAANPCGMLWMRPASIMTGRSLRLMSLSFEKYQATGSRCLPQRAK